VKLTKRGPQYFIGGNWVEGEPSVAAGHQRIYESHLPAGVRLANVILADDEKRLLATEVVPGVNLKALLSKRSQPRGLDVYHYMWLAGRALAVWHLMDGRSSQLRGAQVRRYLDFSVWNVLVDREDQSITILDFPGAVAMGSHYEDMATFLHSMLVVRHHPLVRLKRLAWWDWREAFGSFLEGYCETAQVATTSLDGEAVCTALHETIEREKTRYGTRSWNPRYRLEHAWYARMSADLNLSSSVLREAVSRAGSRRVRTAEETSGETKTGAVPK